MIFNKIRVVAVFVLVFGLSVYYFQLGYFDRICFAFYDKLSENCSYCKSEEHSAVFCPQQSVDQGAYGRWIIPDVGVNVACYVATDEAQSITDSRDSAALILRDDSSLIADHNYQGFNDIKECEIGTVAYMHTDTEIKKYVCTDVLEGYNAGSHLTDLDGNIVEFDSFGGFTNYTCHFFNDKITIVHFVPV